MEPRKDKPDDVAASGRADWQVAAAAELQGADPWKKLTRDVQGLSIKPFYDREDSPANPLRLEAAKGSFHGPRTWFNCPRVYVHDSTQANAQALEHLESGADGIFFELGDAVDFHILLKNIDWPICSLNFLALRAQAAQAQAFETFLNKVKGEAPGAWYGPADTMFPSKPSFRMFGHVLKKTDSPAKDIAQLFAEIANSSGPSLGKRSAEVAICAEIGCDFFVEIAKLRAIRQVWSQMLAVSKVPQQPLHLHAWSTAWKSDAFGPHENMIQGTTSAMAGIMGGCDVLTVDSENEEDMPQRIARNTAILLREESRLAKVADPVAGSYFVDALTSQLADQSWKILETLLKR